MQLLRSRIEELDQPSLFKEGRTTGSFLPKATRNKRAKLLGTNVPSKKGLLGTNVPSKMR